MAPAGARYNSQLPSGAFSHLQQSNLSHHSPQHQASNSGGFPPPSVHHSFTQGSSNPFAPTGNINGLAGGFGPGGGLGAGGTGLASREAQMGFAHGAFLQQQQQTREQVRRGSGGATKAALKTRIRDVWRGNLDQEMQILRGLVDKYQYISMVGPYSSYAHSDHVICLRFIFLRPITKDHRIPNSLALSLDQWVLSLPRQSTIIKHYAVMSTF